MPVTSDHRIIYHHQPSLKSSINRHHWELPGVGMHAVHAASELGSPTFCVSLGLLAQGARILGVAGPVIWECDHGSYRGHLYPPMCR